MDCYPLMPTKEPVPPPKPVNHVRILSGHPHANRIGVLGDPVKIITGALMHFVQFSDGTSCYAANYDFEELKPTSPPPPRKR